VRAGKTYQTGFGEVEIEDVFVIPAALVSEDDVDRSGCGSVEAIWALAGDHTKSCVGPDTLLCRVQFRFLSGDGTPP